LSFINCGDKTFGLKRGKSLWRILWQEAQNPLIIKGFEVLMRGADGTGFTGPFPPLVTLQVKHKMLLQQHFMYFNLPAYVSNLTTLTA